MKQILAAALMTILAANARSAGLRTPFGEVVVKNIKIGQTYSLYRLLNLPMRVVNTGSEETELKIEMVRIPAADMRPGYEPLGSLDWVTVAQSTFTVGANREAATDLIISLPNDPALLGRRFEADIYSHTVSARGVYAVALLSRLMIHVDSTPPSEEELKKKFVDENVANLDFTVIPVNAQISGVPVGRKVDLRKEKKISIKLINPNDRALNFRVRSIPSWESTIRPPEGYEDPIDPKWLQPEKEIVKVDGNSIGETSLTLNVPDEAATRGKKYFFIVSFEVLEQRIPTRLYYRLMAETEPAKKDETKTGK